MIGVLQFPGSCDERDAVLACERVGEARLVWHGDAELGDLDAVVIPGGFSYGDYLRAGAIARFAAVMDAVREFAEAGGPVLGICNGFQVLCEAGMLPGALLPNAELRFICRPVELEVVSAQTAATHGCEIGDTLSIPVKHMSGRWFAPPQLLGELEQAGQIVFRYRPGHNPNGSTADVAGVANASGNVVGLMPHPEHAVDPLTGSADGLALFESLIRSAAPAPA